MDSDARPSIDVIPFLTNEINYAGNFTSAVGSVSNFLCVGIEVFAFYKQKEINVQRSTKSIKIQQALKIKIKSYQNLKSKILNHCKTEK